MSLEKEQDFHLKLIKLARYLEENYTPSDLETQDGFHRVVTACFHVASTMNPVHRLILANHIMSYIFQDALEHGHISEEEPRIKGGLYGREIAAIYSLRQDINFSDTFYNIVTDAVQNAAHDIEPYFSEIYDHFPFMPTQIK